MHNVRLAVVFGPVGAMQQARQRSGIAKDVYPDDPIQLLDTASSNAMGGAAARCASRASTATA